MSNLFTLVFLILSLVTFGQTDSRQIKTLQDSVFVKGDIIKIPYLNFSLSYPLNDVTIDSLQPVVNFLKYHPKLVIEIGCHVDQRSDSYGNESITNFRAKHIFQYLIDCQGIDSTKLKYKGYGENFPIVSEKQIRKAKTDKEREKLYSINNRAELIVVDIE